MRGRNTQTKDRQLIPVTPLRPPRGLELIKSSARLFENGAGVIKPTVRISCPVRDASKNPPAENVLPRARHLSVRAIAVFCALFLVLPSLALATIVWCGTRIESQMSVGARSFAARLASSVVTNPNDPGQTASNAKSDIIIHKVKTERIDAIPWAEGDSR
jgi:hypothetical protein